MLKQRLVASILFVQELVQRVVWLRVRHMKTKIIVLALFAAVLTATALTASHYLPFEQRKEKSHHQEEEEEKGQIEETKHSDPPIVDSLNPSELTIDDHESAEPFVDNQNFPPQISISPPKVFHESNSQISLNLLYEAYDELESRNSEFPSFDGDCLDCTTPWSDSSFEKV